MAPPTWANEVQLAFLWEENSKWDFIKAGSTTLKSFYAITTNTFLEKWPEAPTEEILKEVNYDPVKAQQLVFTRKLGVSLLTSAAPTSAHLFSSK